MSSSSFPQHPAFFHSSPFFYSLFFIISVSPILFPDFRLSPSPFSLPQPVHFDYLSESPSSSLFFSLLPSSLSLSCPYVLPLYMSPFPPASFLFPHLSLSSSSRFLLPLFCTLSLSDFPIIFSTPAACMEL